jgi:hypothetical protein
MTPRGIRLNNPLNIRHGDPWLGATKDQPDSSFVQFESPTYGFRAASRLLLNYQEKHGLTSVNAIIARWAPPSENDTTAYIDAIAKAVGVRPIDAIALRDPPTLLKVLRAMCVHENGGCPYDDATIASGMKLAGVEMNEADFSNVEAGVESTAPKAAD